MGEREKDKNTFLPLLSRLFCICINISFILYLYQKENIREKTPSVLTYMEYCYLVYSVNQKKNVGEKTLGFDIWVSFCRTGKMAILSPFFLLKSRELQGAKKYQKEKF